MSRQAPVIAATLPCRFGGHAPAVAIIHYPDASLCFLDPVQALCSSHAMKGLGSDKGTVVAWLRDEPAQADPAPTRTTGRWWPTGREWTVVVMLALARVVGSVATLGRKTP